MAGSTASSAVGASSGGSRGLWQAPVFVLGVCALLAVVLAKPLLAHNDASAPFRHDLAEARRQLDHADGDPDKAAALAAHVLEAKELHPELAGEADLLLGAALMRQAAKADAAKAPALWADARRHLEAAETEGVSDGEKGRLQSRLGIVGFYTHDDLNRVIARIKTTIDQADDPVQGYTVLTQAYLNLPKPDLQEALAANKNLRNLPQAKEDVLAPARLLGGELLLRMNKPQQAQRALEKVGDQASPEVKAKARRLIARCLQDQGNWIDAAPAWQAALKDGQRPAEAFYNLGVCAQHQDQNDDAAKYWEQCVQAGGEEGQAAALAIAELRLKGQNPETAVEMLAKAAEGVKPGENWTNTLMDRAAAAKLFQEAGKVYLDKRQYDAVLRLVEPFGRLAGPGESELLRAKASAEWAQARTAEARQAATREAKQAARDAAHDLFLRAAAAYATAAEKAPDASPPGEYLWQSARCSWQARDLEQAGARLDQVVKMKPPSDEATPDGKARPPEWYVQRQGEAWFLLGEVRRAQGDDKGANAAYQQCIVFETAFAYRARHQLALNLAKSGKIDDARTALEHNLTLLRQNPDPETQEMSLYALGDLDYQSGRYSQVVAHLGQAIQIFPTNAQATRAHFELADSYRRLADQTHVGATLSDPGQSKDKQEQKLKDYKRYLKCAAKEFLDLAQLLDTPEGQGLLTPEEQVQTPFLAADCLFDYGDYADALTAYQALWERYPGRLEGLNALGGMVRCYSALGDTAKMQQCLEQIDRLLPTMPQQVRDQWSPWLERARKPIPTP